MNCHKNLSLKLVRKLCRVQPLNGVYRYRDGHYGLYFRFRRLQNQITFPAPSTACPSIIEEMITMKNKTFRLYFRKVS